VFKKQHKCFKTIHSDATKTPLLFFLSINSYIVPLKNNFI
jgi:hypothetical protein